MKQSFERYYQRLCYFAMNIVNDVEAAKDIVQDTFVKVYEKNNVYRDEEAFKSYLYSTTKNSALDYLKHKAIKNNYSYAQGLQDNSECFINEVIEAETIAIVNEAVKKLPPECSKVMQLALYGLKNQEIADQLEISVFTVKAQKQRAIKLLKSIIPSDTLLLMVISLIRSRR